MRARLLGTHDTALSLFADWLERPDGASADSVLVAAERLPLIRAVACEDGGPSYEPLMGIIAAWLGERVGEGRSVPLVEEWSKSWGILKQLHLDVDMGDIGMVRYSVNVFYWPETYVRRDDGGVPRARFDERSGVLRRSLGSIPADLDAVEEAADRRVSDNVAYMRWRRRAEATRRITR